MDTITELLKWPKVRDFGGVNIIPNTGLVFLLNGVPAGIDYNQRTGRVLHIGGLRLRIAVCPTPGSIS